VQNVLPEKLIHSVSDCKDLVQCAFSLSEFEVEVYNRLTENGAKRADDLADLMGKDRSTVYRALQKLMTCGMCSRETKSIERGGYYHVYRAISRDELKHKLELCVDDWYERMQQVLAKFGQHTDNGPAK
jgi:predicted transcriptional regulator